MISKVFNGIARRVEAVRKWKGVNLGALLLHFALMRCVMNLQKESKLVQYWADNHLVIVDSLYQLLDHYPHKKTFQCSASSLINI